MYRKVDRNFFYQIIEGRCDLKLMVWKLLKEKEVADGSLESAIFLKYKTYAELFTDFLAREVVGISKKDTVIDIFKDIDLFRDEFEKLSKTMSSFASYKFLKQRKDRIFERLDIISRTGFLDGCQYILCVLKKISLKKELFVLDLEQGREVSIPIILSQKKLPNSFRYYDPIINIV